MAFELQDGRTVRFRGKADRLDLAEDKRLHVVDYKTGRATGYEDLSEVDLSDAEDAKVTVADPAGAVLVHLGSDQFLSRFKIYLSHAAAWRQQFQKLDSVDLRYEGQIIVNPDGDREANKRNFTTETRRHGGRR